MSCDTCILHNNCLLAAVNTNSKRERERESCDPNVFRPGKYTRNCRLNVDLSVYLLIARWSSVLWVQPGFKHILTALHIYYIIHIVLSHLIYPVLHLCSLLKDTRRGGICNVSVYMFCSVVDFKRKPFLLTPFYIQRRLKVKLLLKLMTTACKLTWIKFSVSHLCLMELRTLAQWTPSSRPRSLSVVAVRTWKVFLKEKVYRNFTKLKV